MAHATFPPQDTPWNTWQGAQTHAHSDFQTQVTNEDWWCQAEKPWWPDQSNHSRTPFSQRLPAHLTAQLLLLTASACLKSSAACAGIKECATFLPLKSLSIFRSVTWWEMSDVFCTRRWKLLLCTERLSWPCWELMPGGPHGLQHGGGICPLPASQPPLGTEAQNPHPGLADPLCERRGCLIKRWEGRWREAALSFTWSPHPTLCSVE